MHVAAPARAARRRDRRRGAARGGARRARACGRARSASTSPRCEARCSARATSPSTSPALPWPEPAGLGRGVRGQPAGRGRRGRAGGRPLRLVDGLLYLDRYWRQEEQVRTELAAARRPPRRPSTSTGCAPGWPGCSPTRRPRRTGSGSPRPWRRCAAVTRARRRPGHRQDHHRRAAARAARRPAPAPRCGSRWPRRPARPRPGCRRRCGDARAAVRPDRLGDRRRRPCTGCWAGSRGAAAGSGTTATTGCRTTWSSSTRRRWCR